MRKCGQELSKEPASLSGNLKTDILSEAALHPTITHLFTILKTIYNPIAVAK